jgi:hypothetical protein
MIDLDPNPAYPHEQFSSWRPFPGLKKPSSIHYLRRGNSCALPSVHSRGRSHEWNRRAEQKATQPISRPYPGRRFEC